MQVVGDRRYLLWEVLYIAEVNTITGSWQEDYFWFQSRLHSKDDSKPSAIQDSGSKPWEMGCCFNSFVQLKLSNICHRNITWRAAIFVTAVSNVTANKTWHEKQLCSQRQTFSKKAGGDKAPQMNVGQVNILYMQYILILYYIMSLSPIPYMCFHHQHKDYSLWSSYIISPSVSKAGFCSLPVEWRDWSLRSLILSKADEPNLDCCLAIALTYESWVSRWCQASIFVYQRCCLSHQFSN